MGFFCPADCRYCTLLIHKICFLYVVAAQTHSFSLNSSSDIKWMELLGKNISAVNVKLIKSVILTLTFPLHISPTWSDLVELPNFKTHPFHLLALCSWWDGLLCLFWWPCWVSFYFCCFQVIGLMVHLTKLMWKEKENCNNNPQRNVMLGDTKCGLY